MQRHPGLSGAVVCRVWWERSGPRGCGRQDPLVVSENIHRLAEGKEAFIARYLGGLRFMLASGLTRSRGLNGHIKTKLATSFAGLSAK